MNTQTQIEITPRAIEAAAKVFIAMAKEQSLKTETEEYLIAHMQTIKAKNDLIRATEYLGMTFDRLKYSLNNHEKYIDIVLKLLAPHVKTANTMVISKG